MPESEPDRLLIALRTEFAQKLRAVCADRGLTHDQVAETLGIKRERVTKIVNNSEPTLGYPTIIRSAQMLDLVLEYEGYIFGPTVKVTAMNSIKNPFEAAKRIKLIHDSATLRIERG